MSTVDEQSKPTLADSTIQMSSTLYKKCTRVSVLLDLALCAVDLRDCGCFNNFLQQR